MNCISTRLAHVDFHDSLRVFKRSKKDKPPYGSGGSICVILTIVPLTKASHMGQGKCVRRPYRIMDTCSHYCNDIPQFLIFGEFEWKYFTFRLSSDTRFLFYFFVRYGILMCLASGCTPSILLLTCFSFL